jgi:pyridoxine/pyridoxamine 5'-phosphate oxidase
MNLPSPNWVNELHAALQREWGDRPKIASLATIDGSGAPQVRSIVVREIRNDGSLVFVTDVRSAKLDEMARRPNVQILFWLASQRLQFRLTGEAQRHVDTDILAEQWERLSEASRAMFYWGVSEHTGPTETAQQMPPRTFVVYRVWIRKIDFLSLNPTPHERWIASEVDGWKRHFIAP